jgi:hypothetical protein
MDPLCSILVTSCDDYEDVWWPFFALKERYWELCPYETYISTETKRCPYAITLRGDYPLSQWTRRIREAVERIPSPYILLMDGDFFLRSEVDRFRIAEVLHVFMQDRPWIACFSFEKEYAPTYASSFAGFRIKPNRSPFLNSLQATIWNKEILLSRLQEDQTPWEWEDTVVDTDKMHFVNGGDWIMNYGYDKMGTWMGLRRGKWVKDDVVPLFTKEGLDIDFTQRGFYDET